MVCGLTKGKKLIAWSPLEVLEFNVDVAPRGKPSQSEFFVTIAVGCWLCFPSMLGFTIQMKWRWWLSWKPFGFIRPHSKDANCGERFIECVTRAYHIDIESSHMDAVYCHEVSLANSMEDAFANQGVDRVSLWVVHIMQFFFLLLLLFLLFFFFSFLCSVWSGV